jgi:hypothetical protein
MRTISINLDKIGMTSSLTCAVHCIAMPLVVTFLPYIGLGFIATESFEWAMLLISSVLGIGSVCMGYKLHKNKKVSMLLSLGLALLLLGRFAHENDWGFKGIVILVMGGLTMAFSHWLNNKLCKSCKVCHHD